MKKHLSNQTRKRMLSILGMLLLSVPFVLAQVLVKGTVKDNLGEGVPGASVQVKGTSQGTITDLDGKFTLNIPQKNATLVISFIGYVTVEQKADSQKPMVITLKEDTKTLDEVVVVGYQEVRPYGFRGESQHGRCTYRPRRFIRSGTRRTYRRSKRNFGRRYAGRQHEHRDPW